jgi:molecular chaperone DnaJ
MIQDPYRVLGLSPNASDDEVKAAYRRLAKQYHPDLHGGSAEAEAKMKEINAAYSQIMNRSTGGSGPANGGYGRQGTGTAGGRQGYGGWQGTGTAGGWDSWGGWWNQQQTAGAQESPQMQAARNYINAGHYREALNVLEGIQERGARWYYYAAAANMGLNNNIAALNYARQAVNMDPANLEYRQLLHRLEYAGQSYQAAGRRYGMPNLNSACTWLCLSQLLLSCCCGSRGYYFCC